MMAKRRWEDEEAVLERADVWARAALEANNEPCLIDMMWARLDEMVDNLMNQGEPPEGSAKAVIRVWGEDRGVAKGMAEAIAILSNPYDIDIDNIRALAMERYEHRKDKPKPTTRRVRVK